MATLFVLVALAGCAATPGSPVDNARRNLHDFFHPQQAAAERKREEVQKQHAIEIRQVDMAIDNQRAVEMYAPHASTDGCRPLINYLDNDSVKLGLEPRRGCVYPASYMRAVQKIPNGYLFTEDAKVDGGLGSGHGVGFAFLKTNQDIPSGAYIQGTMSYIGPYTYTALDGFEKTVFGFELKK